MGESVTISKREYDRLVKDSEWLALLEAAGVDNWQGIDYAYELKQKAEEDDE